MQFVFLAYSSIIIFWSNFSKSFFLFLFVHFLISALSFGMFFFKFETFITSLDKFSKFKYNFHFLAVWSGKILHKVLTNLNYYKIFFAHICFEKAKICFCLRYICNSSSFFLVKIKSLPHQEFPDGPPFKYYPGPTMLNFRDQTRTGVFIVVWS